MHFGAALENEKRIETENKRIANIWKVVIFESCCQISPSFLNTAIFSHVEVMMNAIFEFDTSMQEGHN